MKNIAKRIDNLPFWAWPAMGAGAGSLAGGALAFGHMIARVLS